MSLRHLPFKWRFVYVCIYNIQRFSKDSTDVDRLYIISNLQGGIAERRKSDRAVAHKPTRLTPSSRTKDLKELKVTN